ncbi:MAG: endonuclease/exonuclease/phosphatase family protein [Desulfatibacillaceae bacterium]
MARESLERLKGSPRRLAIVVAMLSLAVGVAVLGGFTLFSALLTGGSGPVQPRRAEGVPPPEHQGGPLRVMTVNLAHGRGTAFSQLLVDASKTRDNLKRVAREIIGYDPHVVALQEADLGSFWSGGFDNVAYLAKQASCPWSVPGMHVKGMGLEYGCSLISRLPVGNARSHTFPFYPPTPTKGWVLAEIPWPGRPGARVAVVSLHLDWLLPQKRREQALVFIRHMENVARPLVVMGDFNTEETGDGSVLDLVMDELNLRAWRPGDRNLVTMPGMNMRLDWILVSRELSFTDHAVLHVEVSDHLPVYAELSRRP